MTIYDIIFYLFAAVTLVSAFIVVSARNVVHAAFSLMFTLFGISGLYVLLGADFIAVVQILVYVGGILILMLFGVMLTNKITSVSIKSSNIHTLPAVIGVGLFAGAITAIMIKTGWKINPSAIPETTSFTLGKTLLSEYVLIFELLAMVLLIALVGAASMARRDDKTN